MDGATQDQDATPERNSGPEHDTGRAAGGAGRRRAIVLVPGWETLKRNHRRDTLATGLALLETQPYRQAGEVPVEGFLAARLQAEPAAPHRTPPDAPAILDVIEAYWGDLVRPEPAGNPFTQVARAFGLLGYWVAHRGVRGMFRISRAISVGMAAGAVILLLWYLVVLFVMVQAISAFDLPAEGALLEPVRRVVEWAKLAARQLELWGLVFILPLLIRWRGMAVSRAIASFARDYLRNRRDADGIGLRDAMRLRVAEALRAAFAGGYDDIVLLGHSFGSLPVIDLLGDLTEGPASRRLAIVTWGSPIAVMACRAPWLAEKVAATTALAGRLHWIDVWSDEDWLCTRIPRPVRPPGTTPHEEDGGADPACAGGWDPDSDLRLTFDTTLGDRLSGRSHLFYYTDPRALGPLVHPR